MSVTRSREWLSIADAAEHIGVNPKTIRRRIAHGELKAHKIGRLIRVDRNELDKALKPIKVYQP